MSGRTILRLTALLSAAALPAAGLSAQERIPVPAMPDTAAPRAPGPTAAGRATSGGGALPYLALGVGPATLGIGGKAEVGIHRGRWGGALRWTSMSEFELFGPTPALEAGDVALLLVHREELRYGHVAVGAGLARAYGVERGPEIRPGGFLSGPHHERIAWSALGLPLKLEAALTPRGGIGLVLEGFVNLNGHRTFAGGAIQLAVGRFRR